jgi:hypothetical protein
MMPRVSRRVLSIGAVLLGGALVPVLLSACASIVSGTKQQVSLQSTPDGATVSVDGQQLGSTPITTELRRKDEHTVRIELPGYQPYELTLTKHTNGWVFGNIVFGGLIGVIIDASNGAMYKLEPAQVAATLSNADQALVTSGRGDALHIAVTMWPDPQLERIGVLRPE